MVVLLWFAFLLNQGDRQIYNVVIPLVKADLQLSDFQLGLVATIFTFLYGILVPVAGFAGDRFSKNRIVFLSLLIFSVGTVFTGFANGFILLILFRSIATGAGEAFYYPAANSLIGQHHEETRAQAMSIHQTANYLGIVLGGLVTGYIGDTYGWRAAFYVFGALGVVLAAIMWFKLKGGEEKAQDENTPADTPTIKEVAIHIFKKPTLIFLSIAFGGMVFVHIGYLTWMPTLLHENFDLSLTNAGFSSVFYHHALAFLGVMLGGKVSDQLASRRKTVRMETGIIGLLLGAPFIYWMGATENLILVYVALAGFGWFRGIYDSNLFAALFDVIEPKYRSSATGIMLSFAFIIGSLSPVILGSVKSTFGLNQGISFMGAVYLLSALLIFIALGFFFNKDRITDQ